MSRALDKGQPPGWCMCRAWQRKNFHGRRTLLSSAALIIIKIRMATIMTMYRNDRTNNIMMMMMITIVIILLLYNDKQQLPTPVTVSFNLWVLEGAASPSLPPGDDGVCGAVPATFQHRQLCGTHHLREHRGRPRHLPWHSPWHQPRMGRWLWNGWGMAVMHET